MAQAKPARNGTTARILPHPAASREALMPHNRQAERTLIGTMLIEPAQFADYADIPASAFYIPEHEQMWRAFLGLHEEGKPPVLETVVDWHYRHGSLKTVGGQGGISAFSADVSSFRNAPHMAAIVRRLAKQRHLIEMAGTLAASAYDLECDPDTLAAAFADKARDVSADGAASDADHVFTLESLMAEELPETRWAVPGLIPEGLSLLASKQKIGKSWLALNLVLATAAGGYAVGAIEVPRGPALYLALEDNKKRLQDRVHKLQGDDPIPAGVTLATQWPRFDMGGVIKLERWLKANVGARLVVIDVLAKVRTPRAKHGDMYAEDYAVMSPLKDLADRYHCAIVVIHHTRKAQADDVFDEIRDSSGLTGACDAVMVLQRARGEADATLHLTGRDVEEKELALRMDPQDCLWRLIGNASDVAKSRQRLAIIAALEEASEPMGPTDVAKALGEPMANVKFLMWQMAKDGEIRNVERGRYTTNITNNTNITSFTHHANRGNVSGRDAITNIPNPARNGERNGIGEYEVSDVSDVSNTLKDVRLDDAPEERKRLAAWAEAHNWPSITNDYGIFLARGEAAWRGFLGRAYPDGIRAILRDVEGGTAE